MDIKLTAVTLITSIEIQEDDWMAIKKFKRDNDYVWVSGFGRTKEEALMDFKAELSEWVEN